MGRRSRKRGGFSTHEVPNVVAPGEVHERPRQRKASPAEAPQAPWAPVPLTEICMFFGLVLLGVALIGGGGSRGLMLGFGLTLVTLATLELSLREHLAGFRSHSALLAGICAIAVTVPVALLLTPAKFVVLGIAAVVFFVALMVLRNVFRHRAGGMTWRA